MAFVIAVMARMNGSDPTVAATFVLSRAENERRFRIYCISLFNLYHLNIAIGCFDLFCLFCSCHGSGCKHIYV